MNTHGWEYDVPAGIWRNDDFTTVVAQRAMDVDETPIRVVDYERPPRMGETVDVPLEREPTMIGLEAGFDGSTLPMISLRAVEIGRAIDATNRAEGWVIDRLVEVLANTLLKVHSWVLPPEIRRNDGTHWVCDECGQVFALSDGFGRDDHGRGLHNEAHPTHKLRVVSEPGAIVAVYGIALMLPTGEA